MRKTIAAAAFALALLLNAAAVSAATRTVTLKVEGMTCEGCAVAVEKALKATKGVLDARVSYRKREAWVKYDAGRLSVAKLRKVIEDSGFKVARASGGGAKARRAELARSFAE